MQFLSQNQPYFNANTGYYSHPGGDPVNTMVKRLFIGENRGRNSMKVSL